MRLASPTLKPIPEDRIGKMTKYLGILSRISQGLTQPPESDLAAIKENLKKYSDGHIAFSEAISSRRLAKAFIYSYPGEIESGQNIPFNDEVLNVLWAHKGRTPSLLFNIYFSCYQHLESCDKLASWLLKHYQEAPLDACPSLEKNIKRYARTLFGGNGPEAVSQAATEADVNVSDMESHIGIPRDGSFHDETIQWYYLHHAKQIQIGQMSSILEMFRKASLAQQRFSNVMLGHKIIEILCKKCISMNTALPDNWLQLILNIAGDPRTKKTTRNYQIWWTIQDTSIISLVIAALARRDLDYFLRVLDNFAEEEGGDIERMFHPRRKFMEGILKSGSLVNSLLILSDGAADYLRNSLSHDERQYFTCSYLRRGLAAQCSIYMEFQSGHIVETTHQSKFRIYDKTAKFPSRLRDERPSIVLYQEVTGSDFVDDIVHHPPIRWQYKAMEKMHKRLGLTIDPQDALEESDYDVFITRYSLPY